MSCLSHQDITLLCLDRDQWTNMRSCPDLGVLVTTDTPAHILYTSHSKTQSKKILIPHSSVCNQLSWRQRIFPLNNQDRVLQNISFNFISSVWQIFWPLLSGAQLILPHLDRYQDIDYLVELISQDNVSVIDLPSDTLKALLKHPKLDQCQTLQQIFCGDELLPLELKQQFLQYS